MQNCCLPNPSRKSQQENVLQRLLQSLASSLSCPGIQNKNREGLEIPIPRGQADKVSGKKGDKGQLTLKFMISKLQGREETDKHEESAVLVKGRADVQLQPAAAM